MAYDKSRYDEVQAMSLGDLVHTMLVEFDPASRMDGDEPGEPWQQSNAYFWAKERLDTLLPPSEKTNG